MSTQPRPSEQRSPRTGGSPVRQERLSPAPKKPRRDAGSVQLTPRDEMALCWMGEQYAMRLDHLQRLLARPGPLAVPAAVAGEISPGAAREVLRRWIRAAWANARVVGTGEPAWVWPTRLGLHKGRLPYAYRNMGKAANGYELENLYAINEVLLHLEETERDGRWISERQLLQGVQRIKGKPLLHRPDGELHYQDGTVIAVEVELSKKKPDELDENLVELLRGEKYLRLKAEYGPKVAREMSQHARSQYSTIWYFAPEETRRHLWRARARLVREGGVSAEEARDLLMFRYPPARSEEEIRQDEQEDEQELLLISQ